MARARLLHQPAPQGQLGQAHRDRPTHRRLLGPGGRSRLHGLVRDTLPAPALPLLRPVDDHRGRPGNLPEDARRSGTAHHRGQLRRQDLDLAGAVSTRSTSGERQPRRARPDHRSVPPARQPPRLSQGKPPTPPGQDHKRCAPRNRVPGHRPRAPGASRGIPGRPQPPRGQGRPDRAPRTPRFARGALHHRLRPVFLVLRRRPARDRSAPSRGDHCRARAGGSFAPSDRRPSRKRPMSDLLMAEAVSKTYADAPTPALSDVSFRIGEGEVVALLGHNGAGKSTLFEIVCGLQRADSGTVQRSVGPAEFGWCPQREIIDWSLTVRQNVEMGLAFRRGTLRGVRALAEEVCEVVGLERFLDRQAETLSGGELRRCQIARAIAGRPRLMVLDEPTTGLDPDAVAQVFDFLRDSARQGSTVLVSTHDTSRFAEHCTRVLALSTGRLLADQPVRTFLAPVGESNDLWDGYRHLTRQPSTTSELPSTEVAHP
ncbi:ATP-binding cassette domain-containing protein [Streptomyces kanamyceticus]|uniref:ATP-binding cassette domain-containing protein n=2 Tax=Streptomyces kanamyceticus TaxID=1967 RepID=A0A5J6GQC7_STRKN|nr:ATP-binding cassette domain-containing protein [Streptomyces kanamyceticus]